MEKLYASVPGVTKVLGIDISSGHVAQLSSATITCLETSLEIGDPITVDLGYESDHGLVFTGYVKMLDAEESPEQYTITASDALVRAADYFIVSSTPTTPLKIENASPESIIGQLLGMAGITNYTYQSSSYIWGVSGPIEINLVSSYDYSKMLADMIAWGFWADETGQVHFEDRRPFPMGGDASVGTLPTVEGLISLNDFKSDKNLRNKVVIWGSNGIYAEASAESPYLPAGFYRTSVISAPGIIDSTDMAQSACEFNLSIFNRLTRGYSVSSVGNYRFNARKVLHLEYTDENLYIFSSQHNWSRSGYICNLELRKE